METTFAFDTLAYARKLKAAGVAVAQAEAHAEAVRDAVVQGFASKADIQRLEAAIAALAEGKADKADIQRLEAAIAAIAVLAEGKADKSDIRRLEDRFGGMATKADLAELKVTMLLAVFGAAGALFAALRLFGGAP